MPPYILGGTGGTTPNATVSTCFARVQDSEGQHDDQQRVHVQRKGVPVHPSRQAHDRCRKHCDLRRHTEG